MTRMAGANPKIASIFGGGDFGMDYNKMNNQAYSAQSDLSQAATAADARAYMADKEADNIVEMGKLTAAGIKAGAAGGGGMASQALGAVGQVAGLFGGGGGGGGGGSNPMNPFGGNYTSLF